MIDPDDADAIALDFAMRELLRVAHRHSDPNVVLADWLHTVVAVLITGNWGGRPLESLMLLAARRVASEAACRL